MWKWILIGLAVFLFVVVPIGAKLTETPKKEATSTTPAIAAFPLPTVPEVSKPTLKHQQAVRRSELRAAAKRRADLRRFRADFRSSWGTTTWYANVAHTTLTPAGQLRYFTGWYADSEARDAARQLCNVVRVYYAEPHKFGITDVVVYGADDHPLAWVSTFSGHC